MSSAGLSPHADAVASRLHACTGSATRFPPDERRRLLAAPGIGEVVVLRLEQAGFASLSALRQAGAERVTEQVRGQMGEVAWRNRRRAIARAIEASLPTLGAHA